jgi:hypothetical protein
MLRGTAEFFRVSNASCRDHSLLISRAADKDLSLGGRLALRLHYLMCAPCRHFAQHLRFLRLAAARLRNVRGAAERTLDPARMPEEVRERLRRHHH